MAHTTIGRTNAQRKRLYDNISCITLDADCPEDELKGINYFDVPLEPYVEGNLTGTRLVCELVCAAAEDSSFESLVPVMRAAAEVVQEHRSNGGDTPAKYGAAVGLLCSLQEVFNLAAANLDLVPIFEHTFKYYEADTAKTLKNMRKTNADILAALRTHASKADSGGQHV